MIDQERTRRPAASRSTVQSDKKGLYLSILSWAAIMLTCFICGPASARAATVTLSATPTSRTINQGQSTNYTININRDNYTGSVKLSASNLPSGATASFNPNPTTGKSSTLLVTTNAATPTGTFQIKVSGTASGISINPINVTLIVKPAPSVTLTAMPTTQSIIAGQPISYAIKLRRTNYDGPVTLSANLPDGLTASFEPNPVYGNDSTMRIYSHLLPFAARDFVILASSNEFQLSNIQINLRVNCGVNWAEQFGTTQGADFAEDVAIASDGSIYVTGNDFNPNNGTRDAWVAKINVNGFLQWFTTLDIAGNDFGTEIAVDNSGNVFVGGYTDGTMPNSNNLGGFDFWIAKYNSTGTQQWLKQSGSPAEDGAFGFKIVPDNQGGGQLTTFENDRSVIVTHPFDASGILTQLTVRSLSQQFRHQPNDLALGPNGEVYVAGKFRDESIPNFFNDQGYLIKFNNQGDQEWVDTIQHPSLATDEEAMRVVVDASGNYVYVAAKTKTITGDIDAWLLKYDSIATSTIPTRLWFQKEVSPADDFINALAINNNGDLIVAGKTTGVLGERNGGGFDAWVARRDAGSGNLKWVRQFPVTGDDSFNAIAIDGNNDLILAGDTVFFKSILGSPDALLMRYADAWSLFSPVITGLSTSSGRVNDHILINGLNFAGTTGVRFNGIPATYIVTSSTTIDATVPQGATNGLVTVSSGCNSASSATPFEVTP